MDFNSILIGSEDPKRLVDYYTKVIGEPTFSAKAGFTGWQIGSGVPDDRAAFARSRAATQPGPAHLEHRDDDVQGDFDRMKAAGAIVVTEPYEFEQSRAPGSRRRGSRRQLLPADDAHRDVGRAPCAPDEWARR